MSNISTLIIEKILIIGRAHVTKNDINTYDFKFPFNLEDIENDEFKLISISAYVSDKSKSSSDLDFSGFTLKIFYKRSNNDGLLTISKDSDLFIHQTFNILTFIYLNLVKFGKYNFKINLIKEKIKQSKYIKLYNHLFTNINKSIQQDYYFYDNESIYHEPYNDIIPKEINNMYLSHITESYDYTIRLKYIYYSEGSSPIFFTINLDRHGNWTTDIISSIERSLPTKDEQDLINNSAIQVLDIMLLSLI